MEQVKVVIFKENIFNRRQVHDEWFACTCSVLQPTADVQSNTFVNEGGVWRRRRRRRNESKTQRIKLRVAHLHIDQKCGRYCTPCHLVGWHYKRPQYWHRVSGSRTRKPRLTLTRVTRWLDSLLRHGNGPAGRQLNIFSCRCAIELGKRKGVCVLWDMEMRFLFAGDYCFDLCETVEAGCSLYAWIDCRLGPSSCFSRATFFVPCLSWSCESWRFYRRC